MSDTTVRRLLMGNEAIGLAAIAAGVNAVCGYPGTPSTEILETVARQNPDHAIHVEWSTNEKVALEVAAGVSYAGGRALVTCKQVGLNVASDPLMSLAYVGVRGGLVVVAADDPGPISSQTEQDTRQFAQFAHVPVFDPSTPEEAWQMTLEAFELSERYGCPVILRPTTRVDHGCSVMNIPADLTKIPRHPIGGFQKDPRFVIFPSRSRRAHGRIEADLARIALEFEQSPFNHISEHISDDYELYLGIACSGDSRGYVREALNRLHGLAREAGVVLPSYRLLEVGTPYPFPAGLARDFLLGLADALVIEELEGVVERSLCELTGPVANEALMLSNPAVIHGRRDGTTPCAGEYSVDILLPILARFLEVPELLSDMPADADAELPDDLLPVRAPVLCAGCPHRASFLAMKEAAGRRPVIYSGDIGCYTLGCAHPLDTTDTCLCMGAGVTIAQGLDVAAHLAGDGQTLHVGFVGDSTFFASAMTGIANAVYNQHRLCLAVLDNATTAMTGSQPHPGTGRTMMGTVSMPLSIPAICTALGCSLVEVVDPLDHPAAVAAARRALDAPGVSVIVFKSPCVQLFKPLEAVYVDPDLCRGCTGCVRRTGCPALSMTTPSEADSHPVANIDPSLCAGCDLCVETCPFGAIQTPRAGKTPEQRDAMRREASRA